MFCYVKEDQVEERKDCIELCPYLAVCKEEESKFILEDEVSDVNDEHPTHNSEGFQTVFEEDEYVGNIVEDDIDELEAAISTSATEAGVKAVIAADKEKKATKKAAKEFKKATNKTDGKSALDDLVL